MCSAFIIPCLLTCYALKFYFIDMNYVCNLVWEHNVTIRTVVSVCNSTLFMQDHQQNVTRIYEQKVSNLLML